MTGSHQAAAWVARAAAIASIVFLSGSAAAQSDVAAERGKTLVETHCARCHAVGKTGASPHEKAPPFRTLNRRYPVEQLAESLAEGIVTGHADMPQFAFPPSDVGAIITYLKSIAE